MIRHLIRHTLPSARNFDWLDLRDTIVMAAFTVLVLFLGGVL